MTQALTWMTDPKTTSELNNFEAWKCEKKANVPPAPCRNPNKCALPFKTAESNFTDTRYMETCSDCPNQSVSFIAFLCLEFIINYYNAFVCCRYPWLGDSGGSGIPGKDNYIPDNLRK